MSLLASCISLVRVFLTRWYALVAYLLVMLTLVLAVETTYGNPASLWLYVAFLVTCILAATWCFWCYPLLDAGDLQPRWQYTPQQRMHSLRATIRAPAGMVLIIMLIYLLVITYQAVFDAPSGQPMLRNIRRLAEMVVALVVIVLFGRLLEPLIRTRLKRASALRRVCYHCGYDLRGNAYAERCPECGQAIEWK